MDHLQDNSNYPKEIRPKVEVFVNAVKHHFGFLIDHGYRINKIGLATQYVVDHITEIIYQNDAINRKIVIQYQPINVRNENIDLISVFIFNTSLESYKGELRLTNYIEKHKLNMDIDHLYYPNKHGKGSFKENMEAGISNCASIVKEIWMDFINGSKWEEGPRPRWWDYK